MKISEAGRRKQSFLLANGASLIFYEDTILIKFQHRRLERWFSGLLHIVLSCALF